MNHLSTKQYNKSFEDELSEDGFCLKHACANLVPTQDPLHSVWIPCSEVGISIPTIKKCDSEADSGPVVGLLVSPS